MKLWISTLPYRLHLFHARNNVKAFTNDWELYLKDKENKDYDNAKRNYVEFYMSLALLALSKFDKLDIYNNNRVSDFNKKKLLAEANELRQQVNQMKAKLEAE